MGDYILDDKVDGMMQKIKKFTSFYIEPSMCRLDPSRTDTTYVS